LTIPVETKGKADNIIQILVPFKYNDIYGDLTQRKTRHFTPILNTSAENFRKAPA
jgi:hypothetical protein